MFKLCRMILLVFVVLALAAVAPASAGQAPAAQAPALQAQAAAAPAASAACAPGLDLSAPAQTPAVCSAPSQVFDSSPRQPEFMATTFHGYCRCGCSRTKDCNTSADCGGSACLGGITCC